jgi:cell division septation protein DedD
MRRYATHTATVVLLVAALVAAPVGGVAGSPPAEVGVADIELTEDVISTERGDTVTFTATEADRPVRFEIGEGGSGYAAVAVVNDTDGDGEATLRFNTARSPDGTAAYTAGDDTLVSIEMVDIVDSVLTPRTYDIKVGPAGEDPVSVSALVVAARGPSDVRTLAAPATHTLDDDTVRRGFDRNVSDCSTGADCDPTVSPATAVAHGDQLLVRFTDPALVGLLTAQNTTAAGYSETNATTQFLTAVETGEMTFEMVGTTGADGESRRFDTRLGTNNTYVIANRSNDTHYLVVNTTRAIPDEIVGGELTIRAAPDAEGLGPVGSESPPETQVRVEEPTAGLATDVVGLDGEVTVETNLAPGTELRVYAQRSDVSDGRFITVTSTLVDRNGTARADVVPSAAESELTAGDQFTVRSIQPEGVYDGFERNVSDDTFERNVTVQTETTPTATDSPTPATADSPTPTPTPTDATETTTPTGASTTDASTPTPTDATETTTSAPGLGFVVSVVAVLVAASLARRRK